MMDDAREEKQDKASQVGDPTGRAPLNVWTSLCLCLAGWIIPGLGHLLQGRWARGVVFFSSVTLMFSLGLAMEGKLYGLPPDRPLHILAIFADMGAALHYLLAQALGLGTGRIANPTYDYGTTYLWVSGLLNYLIVLDAFDLARGRKS